MAATGLSNVAVITFNAVPAVSRTFKYDRLGRMALENRRRYCERHGYDFISDVAIASDRPACWAKIPAILEAFHAHEWVLWADSDALTGHDAGGIEPFLDPSCDVIVQAHDRYYQRLGISVAEGKRRMPINTGVFLIRATAWSASFLRRAYARTEFVSRGEIWDGIGEQEAMTALLHEAPDDLGRVKYVEGLQAPPRFHEPGTRFMHLYGNHARHRVPPAECAEILDRWESAIHLGEPLPKDAIRFHWCCIQNKDPTDPVTGGDLRRYLYEPLDLVESRET
jgi:hypothetical protein